MKTQIYVLAALVACSGLLLPVFSAGLLESSATIYSSGVVQQTSLGKYSYIISVSGSNYQMTDGTTGQIVFQSTNSSQVFSNVVGNCSVGSSIDVESGVYAVNTMWTMINVNNVTINFENGARLVAGNNLNTSVLFLFQSNNDTVNGITIDGNAANQAVIDGDVWTYNGPYSPYYMETSGIYIAGSNDVVNNATVFDCRMSGVLVFVDGSFGPAVHSGVINSTIYDCGWNGISLGNAAFDTNPYAINNQVYGCSDVGISTYAVNSLIKGNYVHDLNGTTGGGGNAKWGIAVEGGCNDLITQNSIQNCHIGIHVDQNNCTISENTILNSSLWGICLSGTDYPTGCIYNTIKNNRITQVYVNTDYWASDGIYLTNATFSDIIGNYVSQTGLNGGLYGQGVGIYLDGTSNNNTVSQNYAFDNSNGTGIKICGNNNYITQNQAFDDRSGSAITQKYGIFMYTGASGNFLIGNNVYNNLYNNVYDANVPENTMISNVGYNPIGRIASPISGSTAYLVDSGSNSTWISGRLYTNTGSPKVLNISAGTVSVVAQNGVILFTMTNCTVTLQPGDTFSVTFSTAPTISVIGQ